MDTGSAIVNNTLNISTEYCDKKCDNKLMPKAPKARTKNSYYIQPVAIKVLFINKCL